MMHTSLSLPQKIGQLVVAGIRSGREDSPRGVNHPAVEQALGMIEAGTLGGVILFGENIESPVQTQALTAALQGAAPQNLPLLLAVDQEGGWVQRLSSKKGFQDTPAALTLAAGSLETAREAYETMAMQTRDAGFNWVFGPIVDFHQVGTQPPSPIIGALHRAYGTDTSTIITYARIFMEAHQQVGVLTCLKHYPGHGSAAGDSHAGYTDVTDTWNACELAPYAVLAPEAPAVMTAHVVNRAWSDEPATLVPEVLQRLRKMGFEGVIISDDLHMGAIQAHYDVGEAALKTLSAGADMIILSNSPAAAPHVHHFEPSMGRVKEVVDFLVRAVAEGDLTETRVDEALQRVLYLKQLISI